MANGHEDEDKYEELPPGWAWYTPPEETPAPQPEPEDLQWLISTLSTLRPDLEWLPGSRPDELSADGRISNWEEPSTVVSAAPSEGLSVHGARHALPAAPPSLGGCQDSDKAKALKRKWQAEAEKAIGNPKTVQQKYSDRGIRGKPQGAQSVFVPADGGTPEDVNRRITAAYAAMAHKDLALYQWASMAAFASNEVGFAMKMAAQMHATKPVVPAAWGTYASDSAYKSYLAATGDMHTALAAGNRAIFSDLYWQHLAFHANGLRDLQMLADCGELDPRMLEAWKALAKGKELREQAAKKWRDAGDLLSRFKREAIPDLWSNRDKLSAEDRKALEDGLRLEGEARKLTDESRQHIRKANAMLLDHEQRVIAQATSYDPVRDLWALVTDKAAEMGFPEIDAPLPQPPYLGSKTFKQFTGAGADWGDPDQRMRYLTNVVFLWGGHLEDQFDRRRIGEALDGLLHER